MRRIVRLALLNKGLEQLKNKELERVLAYQGEFLLNGSIVAYGLY